MSVRQIDAFFYGLFMDAAVLEAKGIRVRGGQLGVLRDWALRIGHRATLVPDAGRAVHGVLMSLPLTELDRLYAEASVRMYRPIAVVVEARGMAVPALAYVLPEPPAPEERNPEYAAKLRALAAPLDLFLVRKIGVPGHPEYAMGAIATGGVTIMNPEVEIYRVPESAVLSAIERERSELARRERLYRGDRPPIALTVTCGSAAIASTTSKELISTCPKTGYMGRIGSASPCPERAASGSLATTKNWLPASPADSFQNASAPNR